MRERRDPINQLRNAIDCLPSRTREAMLNGIRTNPIIVGAYTDNNGGICPMLAAHRNGGRVDHLPFARSWDGFTRARRVRHASRRELRILEALLVASLDDSADDVDLEAAIAEHEAVRRERIAREALVTRAPSADREFGDIVARRLNPARARRDAERALERFTAERDRALAAAAVTVV